MRGLSVGVGNAADPRLAIDAAESSPPGDDRPARIGARAGWTICAVVGLLAVLGAARAAADSFDGGPTIRVLLVDGSERVEIDDRVIEADPRGLLLDERPIGRSWQLDGGGIVRVGGLRVRGALDVARADDGVRIVNELGIEDYVAGILGREVYPSWSPETLKAQAVVARTYALHEQARNLWDGFDVVADTRSQVYGGVDAETPKLRAAVEATRGEFLAYDAEPILAVYHSASGGRTASAKEVWGESRPYLVSIPVEGEEDSPDTYWRTSISGTTLGRALAEAGFPIGRPRELGVVARSASGRAVRVRVAGDRGSHILRARDLRGALGGSVIRSTLFEVRKDGDDFLIVGSGHGHGVGMSQWGAQAMALAGASYREILDTFYPGAILERASQ